MRFLRKTEFRIILLGSYWTSIRWTRRSSHACFLVALTLLSSGCRSALPLASVQCSRVGLDPSPPWTASAAWSSDGDKLVLIDPGSRGLATYGRDGKRTGQVELDTTIDLDYSEPMRLERTAEGFAVIDKTRVLSFDDSLVLDHRERPFAKLEDRGFADASFNDVLTHRGLFYGYADFVETTEPTVDDAEGTSTWRRGFVRLDPVRGDLDLLHELPVDSADGEFASYYFYDRRPYVAQLGNKVFILRFTEPWSIHRVTRRGLRVIASGSAEDNQAHALHTWNSRLYVLTSRVVPDPESKDKPAEKRTVARPEDVGSQARLELLRAIPTLNTGRRQWTLHEIEPRSGRTSRRLHLPTAAERLHLIPGRAFWTAIEETTSPNLGGDGERTTLLYLPATELLSGAFGCQRKAQTPERSS